MSTLEKAIHDITYVNKKFPQTALEVIGANQEEAIPFLRDAIERAMKDTYDIEEDNQLHFFALFLLGEFQDREFFPRLLEFVSMPGDALDYLIGDTVTSGLTDILYNTYNGDADLLKHAIRNETIDEFVRADLLDVMGQLYLDGVVEQNDWKEFILQTVHAGKEYSYLYNAIASAICKCHFVDMLPEIRYMLDNDLMDEMVLGKYDSCVDYMFEYHDDDQNFCNSPIRTIDMLKHWAMFEDDSRTEITNKELEAFEKMMDTGKNKPASRINPCKVGRNDPCPCGSGKKYKFCCLNKPKTPLDAIETAAERNKWLKAYPYIGVEREEGRIYLEDYYDSEAIEIDRILYLGVRQRPGLIWLKDDVREKKRCRDYLSIAFGMFVDKAAKENIHTFAEYDRKFSIHYLCKEWMDILLALLKTDGDKELYQRVKRCCKDMLV